MAPFRDRIDAGRHLAKLLAPLRASRPIVMAVARGGVPVAAPVAKVLEAPLDVLVVCKLGAVGQPDTKIGALAETGALFVDADLAEASGTQADIATGVEEIARLVREVRGGRALSDVTGRVVIIVDDGVETGATLRAAARAIRRKRPERLIVAAPVIPHLAAAALAEEADKVVSIARPFGARAIGGWYEELPPVTTADVLEWLSVMRPAPAAPA